MEEKQKEDWTLVIKPHSNWFDFSIKEIWRYKDLILLLVKRDWETVYKQTILGPLWAVIQPLFMTGIFTIIFSKVGNISTEGTPPVLFYLAGLLPWNYFNSTFAKTSSTFLSNANIFGKVYFPRLAVPIASIITGSINFLINLILFLGILFFYLFNGAQVGITYYILLVPFLFVLVAMFSIGLGLIASSLTIKYRDFTFLITFGLQLYMYITPIIYPLSIVPEKYKLLVQLNPLAPIVEGFRVAFLGVGSIEVLNVLYSTVVIFIILFIGVALFNKNEKSFIDKI